MQEAIFCICRKPDDGSLMIQCNSCDEWFHISCVNIKAEELDSLKEYFCPPCAKNNTHSVSDNPDKIQNPSEPSRKKSKNFNEAHDLENPKPSSPREEIKNFQSTTTTPSSYIEAEDPVRRTVREGLYSALQPFWNDQTKYKDCEEFVNNLEEEMFRTLAEAKVEQHNEIWTKCGQRYRAKYRTLQFNLKDPKNDHLREAVFSKHVEPRRLVEMSSQEMANDEVAAIIKRVRQDSIKQSTILEDTTLLPGFVKKTHKGEDYLPGGVEGESLDLQNSIPPSSTLVTSRSSNSASSTTSTTSPKKWQGKIIIPDLSELGRFEYTGSFWRTTAKGIPRPQETLLKYLPHNMHVLGRIAIPTATEYVSKVWSGSNSRDIFLFFLTPIGDDDPMASYLTEHNRWAVVAHDPAKGIRDFYIGMVVSPQESKDLLPIETSEEMNYPLLIGVLVVGKDGKPSPINEHYTYDPHNNNTL